ncbi:MAG: FAD binding domain-containing protein [Candidatus Cloacimonetes bacterium]|nr:FAD binding domain-containing protein [Candidatus Cloacimonadota bacterium]
MDQTQNSGVEYSFNEIIYFLNGTKQSALLPPGLTTLEMLHNKLHLYGTKCSCNEGDCGACTVVISYPQEGTIVYEAINSCLYPAVKMHGKHLITIEGLSSPVNLHPIQQALLEHHGTQCGYCTPGFVMSLFALLASISHPDMESIMAALEGNLCRCTGYQSILDAARELSKDHDPASIIPPWCRTIEAQLFSFNEKTTARAQISSSPYKIDSYLQVDNCRDLAQFLAIHPEATLIAGGTDVMVQVNIARRHFPCLIDICGIAELKNIQLKRDGIHIGAAVTYSRIMDSGIIKADLPALVEICRLIAGKQIRNSGTLVGNIANASPIGDSLPLLLVYEARLLLASEQGERELALRDFFVEYRKTALQTGEYIKEIIINRPFQDTFIACLKTAKRKSVDISAVSSAIRIDKQPEARAMLALGGVAATPVISKTFTTLWGSMPEKDWQQLAEKVAAEFSPLADVRGSAEYRKQMIINHILQYGEAYDG